MRNNREKQSQVEPLKSLIAIPGLAPKETAEVHQSDDGSIARRNSAVDSVIAHQTPDGVEEVAGENTSAGIGKVEANITKANAGDALSLLPDAITEDVVEIYLAQAQAYCDEQQWKKAAQACQEALSLKPATPIAYKLLGDFSQRQGKAADAMGFYARALLLQPHFPEVYSNLGSLYAKRGKWDEAIRYYQKALAADDHFAIAYLHLAKVLQNLGKTAEAQWHLVMALTLNPALGNALEHCRLAQSLEQTGDKDKAITFYRQSIEQSPERSAVDIAACQRLAELLEEAGDWQEAAKYYHKALDLAAGNSTQQAPSVSAHSQETLTNEPHHLNGVGAKDGTTHKRVGNKPDAGVVKAFSPIPTQDLQPPPPPTIPIVEARLSLPTPIQQDLPANPSPSQEVLAAQALQKQDWPKAISHFKQAILQSPQSAVLYRNLAKALSHNTQQAQAAEAWFQAFKLDPAWPSVKQYFELGNTLEKQGNRAGATYCYQQILHLQPNSESARARIQKLSRSQPTASIGTRPGSPPLDKTSQQLRTDRKRQSQLQALKKKQALANVAHRKGEALQKESDWEAACDAYQKAIQLNPKFSWSHHSLGDCYKKLGEWALAADAYRQAIALKEAFVWSHYSLGEVLEQQEQWTDAAKCYQRAQEIDPNNEQVPPKLAGALKVLIKRSPHNIELYKVLAEQLVAQEKIEEAIATYQMAIQIQPDNPELAPSLSKLLADRDPQQAHALLDRALSMTNSSTAYTSDRPSTHEPDDTQHYVALLQYTHLFDPLYYRTANPQVAAEVDATDLQTLLRHYLTKGSEAGYSPNPLFNDSFYRTQHPEVVAQKLNPLVHYYQSGHQANADPHPFFSTAFYKEVNEDVAATGVNPLAHYLTCGAKEGRVAFSAEALADLLEASVPKQADYTQLLWAEAEEPERSLSANQRIGIYCHSLGNYFIAEIADFIADSLNQAGHEAIRLTEQDARIEDIDAHWVVAPHEFFYLGDTAIWMQDQDWLSRCVMVNVEQPQTTWFSKAFHFLRQAKVILDINVKSAAIVHTLGLPAYWLPLGHLSDYEAFSVSQTMPPLRALGSLSAKVSQTLPDIQAPLSERPLDLHFIGTLNSRREAFFAQNAHWLNQFRSFLHIPPMGVPLIKGQDQALDTETVIGLSRRSKILLNVHRDELPYFEWHRIVFHGLWQNTLVVTEPCHDIPGLIAGEHYIACELEEMAEKVSWLLRDPEGQRVAERVRNAGHSAFKETFEGTKILLSATQVVERALNRH